MATDEPAYFILDGNPAAAKYVGGRVVRLPAQDADELEGLQKLEAVSALLQASRLSVLSASKQPVNAQVSRPRKAEYGLPVFQVSVDNVVLEMSPIAVLVWSGPALFREVLLVPARADTRIQHILTADSRRALAPMLDFRDFEPVGRQLELEGPVHVKDHGRPAGAPYLDFIDITWRIKDLPEALADRGIDSLSPYLRVEYVVDTRTGKLVYRNIVNGFDRDERRLRLFKEAGGPLLMAATVDTCEDGGEPLILDLEHESYGTGRKDDVPDLQHCFPGQ